MKPNFIAYIRAALAALIAAATPARAEILPEQVLVVYNSPSADATAIRDAYLAAHPDIPSANILDLNQPYFVNVPADISYGNFISRIRTPIRNFLSDGQPPEAQDIISIVLIRGIPHRVYDTDNAGAGDFPTVFVDEFIQGDATAASVDAEMVLLWQDLDSGENGGDMDSYGDNMIENPYHGNSVSITNPGFPRTNIQAAKTFNVITNSSNGAKAWELAGRRESLLTPGDMYLVCRIDGNTAADAVAVIDRAQSIVVNQRYAWIILDEFDATPEGDDQSMFSPFPDPFYAGNDYEETVPLLTAGGWNVEYDTTGIFILGPDQQGPVIAYSGFGENHDPDNNNDPPGDGTYIETFTFARGAIFNTYESYNARALNGLDTLFDQEQLADFIGAGGTFGIGNVWEPFAALIPDNEFLFVNFLANGMTWAEAAYTAIPALSWMHIVIGDPLAQIDMVVDQPADFTGDGKVDQADFGLFQQCITGPFTPQNDPPCRNADLDGDGDVDQSDFGGLQRCFSGPDALAEPGCLQ